MLMKFIIPLILILIIIPNKIKTDLPIHCKREEIEGEWIFRINKDSFEPNLADYRSTCGHGFPDKIEKLESDINYSFDNFMDVPIFLGKDYKIYDPISNQLKGKWTPVYDEGFIVNYEKSVFTAFMKYYLKPDLNYTGKNKNAVDDNFLSNCKKTMIGWFIMDQNENNKNWSCFFGFKKEISDQFVFKNSKNNILNLPKKALKPNKNFSFFRYFYYNKKTNNYDKENDDSEQNDDNDDNEENENIFRKNRIKSNNFKIRNDSQEMNSDLLDSFESNSFLEMKSNLKSQIQNKIKLEKIKYEDQNDIINEINSKNLSWTAHMHENFKGLSFMDLKIKLGLRDNKKNESSIKDKHSNNIFESGNLNNYNNFATDHISIEDKKVRKTNFKKKTIDSDDKNLNNSIHISKNISNININRKTDSNILSPVLSMNSEEFSQSSKENSTSLNNKIEESEKDSNREKDGQFVDSFEEISKYFDKELDEIDQKRLPKNWDWRNIGGVNYVPEPKIQGNCGSCYVFSMISSLESRLRIQTNNKDKTTFSRQFPISCNFYTEGCKGGYPILVAKFSSEFELIPESCLEYSDDPSKLKCSNVCDYKKFEKKYFVSKYEYLGGFYGNTNEIEIMKELRARGPVPGNMNVPISFSFYEKGIYSQNFIKKNSGFLNKTTMLDNNLSWSTVDHSILLVGYGEENGTKYWIGMNTWGKNWGENGFFRIIRGENDCNIETMGDAARISFKLR